MLVLQTSRRKRTDSTYIAQLIGRMIRTPLARRIPTMEELNTVDDFVVIIDDIEETIIVSYIRHTPQRGENLQSNQKLCSNC